MAMSLKKVSEEILHLPEDQRLTLAHKILSSVEPAPDSKIEEAWDSEIRHRIRRYDQGKTKTIPASKVFEELDKRFSG